MLRRSDRATSSLTEASRMWSLSYHSFGPRCRGVAVNLLALGLLAACSDLPTPPDTARRPALDLVVTLPTTGTIAAVNLGVLPGDVASRATFVAEDGAVYGR